MSLFKVAPEAWMEFSFCKGADPKIFVLERGVTAAEAKRSYCSNCPVTAPCLEYGIRTDSVGVWGGVVLTDRDNITELFPLRPVEAMKVEPVSAADRKRVPAIFATMASASGFRHPSVEAQ